MLPNPDDYKDWREYVKAFIAALEQGALTQAVADDPFASTVFSYSGITGNPPSGYSPVWLKDDAAELWLGDITSGPPAADALFQIDTLQLAEGAVTGTKIEDATILTAKIGDAQIVSAKIADLAVNEGKIANLAVTVGKIANLAVETAKINDLAVSTAKIGALAVTSAKIGNLAVGTAQIDNLAVTNAKMGSLAVAEANIGALAVTQAKIGLLAVGSAQIADLAVSSAKIANLAVGSAQIADLAVASGKIADLSVGTIKIAGYAVDVTKIASLAVSEYAQFSYTSQTITISTYNTYFTLQDFSSNPVEVDISVPNVTGTFRVLILAEVTLYSDTATSIALRVRKDGSAVDISPARMLANVPVGDSSHVLMVMDTAPDANTTHTYTLQALIASGAGTDYISDVNLVAILLKR